jgi:hypothetical protein
MLKKGYKHTLILTVQNTNLWGCFKTFLEVFLIFTKVSELKKPKLKDK